MKERVCAGVFLLIVGGLLSGGVGTALGVTQVSSPGVSAGAPVINDQGQMAWLGYDGASTDIYLYDGTNILRLDTPGVSDRFQRINNAGQVAWEGFDGSAWGIYFYDGSAVRRLTASGCSGNNPELNDSGVVVWSGSCDPAGEQDIFMCDGLNTEVLGQAGAVDMLPQINNRGDVVWLSYAGNLRNICFYDGSTIQYIPNFSCIYFASARLNDNGDVAWSGYDGSDWDVYFYDGGTVTRLDNPNVYDGFPLELNNSGEIAWQGIGATGWEIFLFNGQTVIPLTDNLTEDRDPKINDDGYVVWRGFDGTDWEIFRFNGTNVNQMTDNTCSDQSPQINDQGTIAWLGSVAGSSAAAVFYGSALVDDWTPPVISDVQGPDMLWPPNHKMVPVSLTVVADDNSGAEPVCRIISVTSNEPQSSGEKGDESSDWMITGALTLKLRAERLGAGAGRTYTITVECTDAAGNTATDEVTVKVPKNQSGKP